MPIAGIALLVLGIALILIHRSQQRKLADIVGTETMTVAALQDLFREYRERGGGPFQHRTELKGTLECDQPLISELGGQPCVYYRFQVEREWEEDYWTTNPQTRHQERHTRRGSDVMASNERAIPFCIRDATGSLLVDPKGADLETIQSVNRFEPGEAGGQITVGGFILALGQRIAGGRRTLGYRFQEWLTPVGHEAYVLGTVRDVNGELRVCLPPEGKGRFLVSLRSEEELVRTLRTTLTALQVGIAVCLVAGAGLLVAGLTVH